MYWSRITFWLFGLILVATALPAWADRADDDYAVAARHYERGRWQAAIDEFQAFLRKHPEHQGYDEAQFLLGEAQVQLGRHAEAQATFRAFLTSYPDHNYAKLARFRLGESAFLVGDHAIARQELDRFQAAYPRDALLAYVLPYLAEMALTAGEGVQAETYYARALREYAETPYQRECRFGLAQALELQGKRDDALRFYRFLAQSSDSLGQSARLRTAMLLYQRAELADAIALLQPFDRGALNGDLRTEARYWLARCYLAKENWEQADQTLQRALEPPSDPKLVDALTFFRGEALRRGGKATSAEPLYRRVTTNWPTSPWADDALQCLIQSAFETERFEHVIELAQQFSNTYSDSDLLPDVQRWEGRAQLKRQAFAAAAERFEALIESYRDPRSPWAHDANPEADKTASTEPRPSPATRFSERAEVGNDPHAAHNKLGGDPPLPGSSSDVARSAVTPSPVSPPSAARPSNSHEPTADPVTAARIKQLDAMLAADRYYLSLAYLGQGRSAAALEALAEIPIDDASQALTRGVLAAQANALLDQKRFAEAIEPLSRLVDWDPAQASDASPLPAPIEMTSAMPDSVTDTPTTNATSIASANTPPGLESAAAEDGPRLSAEQADAQAKLVVALVETDRFDDACQLLLHWRQLDTRHPLLDATTRYTADRAAAKGLSTGAALYQQLADSGTTREGRVAGWLGLGRLAQQHQQYQQAAAAFGHVIELAAEQDDTGEASLAQARAFEHLKDHDAARAAYARTYVHYGQTRWAPEAMLSAAQFEQTLAAHEAAAILLQHLLAAYPDYAQSDAAWYELAWSAQTLQDGATTQLAYETVVKDYPQSRYRADSLFRLAEEAAQRGDPARAILWLEQLLTDASTVDANPSLRCHAIYLRGKLAADASQWDTVLTQMQTVVQEFPDHALHEVAEYWLAEAYFRTAQWTQAEPIFASLHARQNDRQEIWRGMVVLRLAQIAARQKNWSAAYELAQSISKQFPQFPQQQEVHYLLGRCLSGQARFREARDYFQEVIDSPSAAGSELAAVAQWMVGESYLHQKNYVEAIRAYHRVETLHEFPKWQAIALFQAAKCHELLQHPDEARTLYDQLLQDHPHSSFTSEAQVRRASLPAKTTP